MLKIRESRHTEYNVEVEVKVRYQCDNCGELEEHITSVEPRDLKFILSGNFEPEQDCSKCQDRLIPCGFYGDLIVDLTQYQADATAMNIHLSNILPYRGPK